MRRWLIITASGKPVSSESGTVLLFKTEAEARKWALPTDTITPAADDIAGTPALDYEPGDGEG